MKIGNKEKLEKKRDENKIPAARTGLLEDEEDSLRTPKNNSDVEQNRNEYKGMQTGQPKEAWMSKKKY